MSNFRVTTIEVSFTREKQPAQYEKSAPFVKLAGASEEGESGNHVEVARRLMTDACGIVYAALGMDIPNPIIAKLGADPASVGTVKVNGSTAVAQVANGMAAAPTPATDTAESKKRGPGRPPKDKAPTLNGTATEAKPQISVNPEDRKNPADEFPDDAKTTATPVAKAEATSTSEFPDDTKAAAAPEQAQAAAPKLTQGDVQSHITSLVQGKKITVPEVKAIMAEFKTADGNAVGRCAELRLEDCADMKAKVDEAVKKKG